MSSRDNSRMKGDTTPFAHERFCCKKKAKYAIKKGLRGASSREKKERARGEGEEVLQINRDSTTTTGKERDLK